MMTKLREMSFIFLWILVFAFLGLMVLEWGMDLSGRRSRKNVVGKIAGRKITLEEFQNAMREAYLVEKERTGKDLDEERMKQLRDEVWESLVQRILFQAELKKHHVQVTDRELALYILNNPPSVVQQNENFQTNGKFDIEKYKAALRDPNIGRLVEEQYRQILPLQKLQALITSAATVTEQEVRDEFMRQNVKAKIEYLHFPASSFSSEIEEVPENEIREYYKTHKEDFKVEEKRKLNYVLFSTSPTAEDTARTYRIAEDILQEARTTGDFAKLADEFSEDPSVQNNHGDLGYFEKSAMVPEFAEAAFATRPGEIVGPVKTRFGLHIIKVVDRKMEEGQPKVRASHILFKFSPSANTIENAQYLANNFMEMARDEGFNISADRMKYQINQTAEFPKRNYIPGFGIMKRAVEWAFKAEEGDISDVYRTQRGYAVFQVAEIRPEGYRPFGEVKNICQNRVKHRRQKEVAKKYAERFKTIVNQGKDFNKIAQEDTGKVIQYNKTAEFTMGGTIPGIGRITNINAAAFTLPLNTPSNLLETDRGYYYIKVLERTEFDEEAFNKQRNNIRNRLLQQKRQQVFLNWYNRLKEKAKIEDNRDEFFRS